MVASKDVKKLLEEYFGKSITLLKVNKSEKSAILEVTFKKL